MASGCFVDRFRHLGLGGPWLVRAIFAEQCPHDVDAAAGEGEYGLGMFLALGSFPVIKLPGVGAAADADQGGVVEDPVEAAVLASRPLQVAADPPGVPRGWGQPREPGQPVRAGEPGHAAAGGGEELRAEQGADAGHAGDHFCVAVAAKSVLDELAGVADPLAECDHLLGQVGDQGGGEGGMRCSPTYVRSLRRPCCRSYRAQTAEQGISAKALGSAGVNDRACDL
jgi:hypothetical protein